MLLKPNWMDKKEFDHICEASFIRGSILIENDDKNQFTKDLTIFELTDLIIKLEIEKREKDFNSDLLLDYDDEITSIEEVGIKPTMDITVSGDNLFYCNGLLTKNSMGVAHTLDLFLALIVSEDLDALNQIMIKQLKNRYNDVNYYRKFILGLDKSRMKFYDAENSAQENISESGTKCNGSDRKQKFGGFK